MKFSFTTKALGGFTLAALVTGYMNTGTGRSFSSVKKAYSGGISMPWKAPAMADKVVDGAFKLAMMGSKIPVAGPSIIAPLVSGTYGLLWGWTY